MYCGEVDHPCYSVHPLNFLVMKTALWLEPQLNEITFEHRNKSYGAFPLRSDYHRKMAWSMLLDI